MSYLDNPPVVTFGGVNLNIIDGLLITDRGVHSNPTKNARIYKLARTDKSILTAAEYSSKIIVLKITIARPTRQELDAALDQLHGYLQGNEQELVISQSGQNRTYTATVTRVTIQNSTGGLAQLEVEMTCSDPFGYESTLTTLCNVTGVTTSATSTNITVGGSFDAEPIFTITLSAVTGGTGQELKLYNGETGVGISVTRNWVAGDVLTINGTTKEVRINGVLTSPSGKVLSFPVGLRVLAHSDTFTTRTLSITGTYYKRYV